jgi:hypothetical protein
MGGTPGDPARAFMRLLDDRLGLGGAALHPVARVALGPQDVRNGGIDVRGVEARSGLCAGHRGILAGGTACTANSGK